MNPETPEDMLRRKEGRGRRPAASQGERPGKTPSLGLGLPASELERKQIPVG